MDVRETTNSGFDLNPNIGIYQLWAQNLRVCFRICAKEIVMSA